MLLAALAVSLVIFAALHQPGQRRSPPAEGRLSDLERERREITRLSLPEEIGALRLYLGRFRMGRRVLSQLPALPKGEVTCAWSRDLRTSCRAGRRWGRGRDAEAGSGGSGGGAG